MDILAPQQTSPHLSTAMTTDILTALTKIAATMTPDDRDVEKAFAEQSFNIAQNKAGILMTDPYRIGFEVIHKNDTNTQLLGAWAYRLGRESQDQLCFAPCMFVDGKIKGSDLLYRAGPKKFVPHTPEWGQYLVDITAQSLGKSQPASTTGKLQPLFQAEKFLRTPAAFGKQASSTEDTELLRHLADDWCKQVKVAGVLRDFMARTGKLEALDRFVDMMEHFPKFASAVSRHFSKDDYMPPEMEIDEPVKQASEPDTPVLRLYTGIPDNDKLQDAWHREKVAADLYRAGYSFDEPDSVPVPEHVTQVYDGGAPQLRSPTQPGVVDLVLASGNTVKAVVGLAMDVCEMSQSDGGYSLPACPVDSTFDRQRGRRLTRMQVYALDSTDDGVSYCGTEPLWSEPEDTGALKDAGVPITEITAGSLYAFINPEGGQVTSPGYVINKRKVGDVWHVMLAGYSGGGGSLMIINPDASQMIRRNVINTKWRAIKVPHTTGSRNDVCCGPGGSGPSAPSWVVKPLAPATDQDIRASYLNQEGLTKKAALTHDNGLFTLRVENRSTLPCKRLVMMTKLAGMLAIDVQTAESMLDMAVANTTAKFALVPPVKMASAMLQLVNSPQFEQTTDPVHMIPMDRMQVAVLRTQRAPIYMPAARIGDKSDPIRGARNEPDNSMEHRKEVPVQLILQGSPDEIAQYAADHKLPHVFDHGAMMSLAKTYDSQLHLDMYLPKIEDGIDSMGRCIFLFYRKPEDWRDLYGTDDLQELEDQLLSSFKGQGDLLLNLLKKSRSHSGNPS